MQGVVRDAECGLCKIAEEVAGVAEVQENFELLQLLYSELLNSYIDVDLWLKSKI